MPSQSRFVVSLSTLALCLVVVSPPAPAQDDAASAPLRADSQASADAQAEPASDDGDGAADSSEASQASGDGSDSAFDEEMAGPLMDDDDQADLPDSVVTATRTNTPVSELTRSVTALDREAIDQQAAISRDLGDILGKTVPGMATSTEGLTSFTQTLRGRRFLTMIDGVPISTPLRDGQRDLKSIDPSALDRVEVIRGGTAVYGFGATGGLINYITRDPVDEGLSGFSEAGFKFNTQHPGGSLQSHTAHGASGQLGPFDFLFNGSFTDRNRFFDADRNRLPAEPLATQGGLGDTYEWNILGKVGLDFDQNAQRVELMINNYDISQHTDLVASPGDPGENETATGVTGDPTNTFETENSVLNFSYEHRDVLGSLVKLQAYHQDYTSGFGTFPLGGGQQGFSTVFSEKIGTRLTIQTPLWDGANAPRLVWGLDYQNDRTAEPVGAAVKSG